MITEAVKIPGKNKIPGKKVKIAVVVTVHAPSDQSFAIMDWIAAQTNAVVSRLDIAADFAADDPDEAKAFLTKRLIIKHRPKATRSRGDDGEVPLLLTCDVEDTTYWHQQTDRIKRTNRELVCYSHRRSKITDQPCAHLELRFQRAAAVRRLGVHKPSDATRLNPAEVFDRNLSLIEISQDEKERVIKRLQRRASKRDRFEPSQTEFDDKYRAAIPRRIRGHVMRVTLDRAQDWLTVYGVRGQRLPLDELAIPTAITVPVNPANTTGAHTEAPFPNSLANSMNHDATPDNHHHLRSSTNGRSYSDTDTLRKPATRKHNSSEPTMTIDSQKTRRASRGIAANGSPMHTETPVNRRMHHDLPT